MGLCMNGTIQCALFDHWLLLLALTFPSFDPLHGCQDCFLSCYWVESITHPTVCIFLLPNSSLVVLCDFEDAIINIFSPSLCVVISLVKINSE